MLKADAKKAVVREWLELPPSARATQQQAFIFAMAAKDRYRFRCSGDRYQHIMGWLAAHIGKD